MGRLLHNMWIGGLGHAMHLKISGALPPLWFGFCVLWSRGFLSWNTGSIVDFFSLKSGSDHEKMEMKTERMLSPLDELFYNKLPAGVRKCEIWGFQLPQKLTQGRQAAALALREDMLNPTQPLVSGFPWKTHLSPVSLPSSLGSHSTCAQRPPRDTQLLTST